MLVRALLLRYEDHPIARQDLREFDPLLGNLRYSAKTGILLLMPVDGNTDPIVQLFKCRNLVAEKRGLIYQGSEDRWRSRVTTPVGRSTTSSSSGMHRTEGADGVVRGLACGHPESRHRRTTAPGRLLPMNIRCVGSPLP